VQDRARVRTPRADHPRPQRDRRACPAPACPRCPICPEAARHRWWRPGSPERPEAELRQVRQLRRRVHAVEAVRAHDDPDSSRHRVTEARLLALEEVAHLLDCPGRNVAARDPLLVHQREVDEERGDQRDVPLEHQVDPLFVDEIAVLDARDAGTQRVLDAGRAFGVRQCAANARRGRFLDDRSDLVDRELAGIGRVGGRQNSAGGHHLDPIRARPYLEACRAPDRIYSVGDPGRQVGRVRLQHGPRRGPAVAVPTGLGKRRAANLRPRTGESAARERPLDAGRCVPRIANGGHASFQEGAAGLQCPNDQIRGRPLNLLRDGLEAQT